MFLHLDVHTKRRNRRRVKRARGRQKLKYIWHMIKKDKVVREKNVSLKAAKKKKKLSEKKKV